MKVVAAMLLGSGLFVGTAFGMLALQGRLNYSGTKGIPLVHSLFSEPPEEAGEDAATEEEHAPPEEEHGSPDEDHASESDRSEADTRHGGDLLAYNIGRSVQPNEADGEPIRVGEEDTSEKSGTEGREPAAAAASATQDPKDAGRHEEAATSLDRRGTRPYRPGRLFEFPSIRAGISVSELNQMLEEAKSARERARAELAVVEKRKRDLDAREADIKEREEQILAKIREIEQSRARLEEKIEEFQRTVTLIHQDEAKAIKADADTLAAFEPRFASQLIQQWWRTEDGQRRVVKILTMMDAEAANAILQVMDPAQAREILDRRARVVAPRAGR